MKEVYGRWTVIKEVPSKKLGKIGDRVECQCECGKIAIKTRSMLKHPSGSKQCIDCMYIYRKKPTYTNRRKSPGSGRQRTIYPPLNQGDVFGNLTIIKADTICHANNAPSYLCLCKCGRECNIFASRIANEKLRDILSCLLCYRKKRHEKAVKSTQAAKGKYYDNKLGIWTTKKPI